MHNRVMHLRTTILFLFCHHCHHLHHKTKTGGTHTAVILDAMPES
jgi:hypothetical protein